MPKCMQCDHGTCYYEDEGHMVSDTCYHCGGTGVIDEEQVNTDNIESLAYHMIKDCLSLIGV